MQVIQESKVKATIAFMTHPQKLYTIISAISYWSHRSILFIVGGDYTRMWIAGEGVIGGHLEIWLPLRLPRCNNIWEMLSLGGQPFSSNNFTYKRGDIWWTSWSSWPSNFLPESHCCLWLLVWTGPQFLHLHSEFVLSYYLEISTDMFCLGSRTKSKP